MLDNRIDAVTEVCQPFLLEIVGNFIGLRSDNRAELIEWGAANFDVLGRENDRFNAAMPAFGAAFGFMAAVAEDPGSNLSEGSVGQSIFALIADQTLSPEQGLALFGSFLFAGIDTTAAALANAIQLLGLHADQWRLLKSNPELVPSTINEVLRYASPVLHFKRVTTRQTELAGITVEAGTDIVTLFACANRDGHKIRQSRRISNRTGIASTIGLWPRDTSLRWRRPGEN